MGAYSITEGRINATYGYGETLLGKGKGITSLMDNLTYNFGVSFDHYLVLNLQRDQSHYIDKIGGVVIHLDQAVSDGWSNFSSGDHHFDGNRPHFYAHAIIRMMTLAGASSDPWYSKLFLKDLSQTSIPLNKPNGI